MAIQIHLKIPGIEGEATHRGHEKEIDVRSWAWGVDNPSKPGTGGGGGAGKAVPHDLVFTHAYDKASPLLAKSCAKGTHLATATLSARKAGKGQQDFLVITLKDVLVTSLSVYGDDDIGESVALAYGGIDVVYKPQDAKGGLGPGVGFDWNVKTNKVT